MLSGLIAIAAIFITIIFVIGTHEAAHFYTARLLGVKVLRFSIGFGKTLLRFHDKSGTEYVFALIPLGGYVKMLDETEGTVSPEELHRAYNRQPYYKKFLIVFAGPASNLLCAFLLYWVIFVVGFMAVKPIVGEVTPNSIAADAKLQTNQEIIAVDNIPTPTWSAILFRLVAHMGDQDQLRVTTKDTSQKTTVHYLNLATWQMDELSPDPLSSLGIAPFQPEIPLVVGVIEKDSPASKSSLKIGDKLLALDKTPVKNWNEVILYVMKHPDQTVNFHIMRQNSEITIPVTIGYQHNWLWQKQGYLGIKPTFTWPKNLIHRIQFAPLTALFHAWQQMIDFASFNLLLFWKMITGKISLQSLGGPITIFESAGQALNYGFISFLNFLAFLSISIGIINFLPIPGLDGAHLLFQTVEAVIRRPLPERLIFTLYRLGFIFLILILFQALVNDMVRLYT